MGPAGFRRFLSPAARDRVGKRERASWRTGGWWFGGSGWPVAGSPRAPAAGGGALPLWRRSGEAWRCRWAGELHGEARKVLGYSIWAMGERTGGSPAVDTP